MNYYPHHIGDYLTATAHLTMLEDGAYRRLLDLYYSREEPIPVDVGRACRLVRAMSDDDRQAVQTVLEEFFTLSDSGWTHQRCEEEIGKAAEAAERSRKNGRKGGRPRDTKPRDDSEKTQQVISGLAGDNPEATKRGSGPSPETEVRQAAPPSSAPPNENRPRNEQNPPETPKNNPEETQQVISGIPEGNPEETKQQPSSKAPNPNPNPNPNPKTKEREEGQNTCAPRREKGSQPDPKTGKKGAKTGLDYTVFPDDLSPQVLNDWLTMRKGIKAPANTQTVLNAIAEAIEECRSLGLTPDQVLTMAQLKAWRGLRKDWVANELAKRGEIPRSDSGNVSQLSPVGERTKRNMEAWLANG